MTRGRHRLLIIDDDPRMQELIREALLKKNVHVASALDGASGLALAQQQPFDLVLIDLGLPAMDGFEVCRLFKAETNLCQIPLILITGRDNVADKIKGFEIGVVDFINKPFDLSELHARIAAILRHQRRQARLLAVSRHEKQRTQQELLRISKAMDSTSDAISITDAGGHHLYHNAAYQHLFGVSLAQLRRDPSRRAYVIEPGLWNSIWQTCRQGSSWRGELNVATRPGHQLPLLVRVNAIHDDQHRFLGTVWMFTDISERKRLEHDLVYLATHDPLTHLQNRRSFVEQLEHAVQKAKLGAPGALLFLDVDFFKVINDTLGHQAGDQVLVEMATLLQQQLRSTDCLGRLGGDEFAILLSPTSFEQAQAVAEKLVGLFDAFRCRNQGREFTTRVSIGLAPILENTTVQQALAHADAACILAKAKGRNRWEAYQPGETGLASSRCHEFQLQPLR